METKDVRNYHLQDYKINGDSIIIPKHEVERLMEVYKNRAKLFAHNEPFKPQTWAQGYMVGKHDEFEYLLSLFDK